MPYEANPSLISGGTGLGNINQVRRIKPAGKLKKLSKARRNRSNLKNNALKVVGALV